MTEPKRKRVKTACNLCRKRKLRCDGQKPCLPCQSSNSMCSYDVSASAIHDTADMRNVECAEQDETIPMEDASGVRHLSDITSSAVELTICNQRTDQREITLTNSIIVSQLHEPSEFTRLAPIMTDPSAAIYDSTQSADISLQPDNIFEVESDFWQVPLLVRNLLSASSYMD